MGPLFPSLAKQWMHKKSAKSCQSYSKNQCSRIQAPGRRARLISTGEVLDICTVPPGSTIRPGQGDERDSLFLAHDEQEIFRVQCLTQCWTLHTSTESIYLTGRKISFKSQLPIEHVDVPGHSYLYFQSYQKLWDGFTMKWPHELMCWRIWDS